MAAVSVARLVGGVFVVWLVLMVVFVVFVGVATSRPNPDRAGRRRPGRPSPPPG
jgi:hypothetical protein